MRLSIEEITESINDALVIDLLPSGLEIENTHLLENESLQQLTLPDMSRTVADALVSLEKNHEAFLDDRYLAALPIRPDARHHLFYLVRVISAGNMVIPPPYVEDMYRPDIFGVGAPGASCV
ncbi:MAG: hypothetical protein R3E89_00940 [Thiolinea sp.]